MENNLATIKSSIFICAISHETKCYTYFSQLILFVNLLLSRTKEMVMFQFWLSHYLKIGTITQMIRNVNSSENEIAYEFCCDFVLFENYRRRYNLMINICCGPLFVKWKTFFGCVLGIISFSSSSFCFLLLNRY